MNDFFNKINFKYILQDAWSNQLPGIRRTLFISFIAGLGGIITVYIMSLVTHIPPSWFTRDPNDISGAHFYVGLLSNLGIMGWTASATMCFWAVSMLNRDNHFRKSAFFLIISGFICLLLDFDDAFMLHERVWPNLHVPEKGIFLGYTIIMSAYMGYFFYRIMKTEYLILVLAVLFLGLSAAVDQIFSFSEFEAFLEDCPKFIGIVLWLAYYYRTSSIMVKDSYSGTAEAE